MKRGATIVAVNIAVLVVGLLAVELAFGSWLSKDPLANLNLHRNERVTVDPSPLYAEGSSFVYQRDEWGFRGFPVDPAKVDIVTIGGSTTNQLYLPDHTTWQAALSRALAEAGRPITVANAGIDGQTTVGMLYNLERWFPNVPGLKPRMVLAYVGVNDATLDGQPTIVDRLGYSSLAKRIREQSAVMRLLRTAQGMLSARHARLMHERLDPATVKWTDKGNFPDAVSARPGLDYAAYRARLVEMARRIRAMGAQPVFVTQQRGDYREDAQGKGWGVAQEAGLNGIDEWRVLDAVNRITLNVCTAEKVACLDLAGELRFEDGDFYDYIHNTPQGAVRIGRWMAEKLAPLL